MNVAVLPCLRATFLTMYLYLNTCRPSRPGGENFMSISHCPAVANLVVLRLDRNAALDHGQHHFRADILHGSEGGTGK